MLSAKQLDKHGRPPRFYVKCCETIRLSNTGLNVAMVATMFNMVPISVDGSENPERAASAELLLFAFCFFAAIADPVGPGP
jgi:hypothetical protein